MEGADGKDQENEGSLFSALDRSSLASIACRLDGQTLARFQAVSTRTREACLDDIPWRACYQREFPQRYKSLAVTGTDKPWRQLYRSRQLSERRWATGQPAEPCHLLRGHNDAVFAADVLKDPFPSGRYVVSVTARDGAVNPEDDRGELVLWDLDRRSDVTGRQAWALKPPGGPSNSEMVRRGIFFVIQRPGTREIICPSTTAAVHVAVVTPRSGGDGNVAEDLEANMDVVMAAEGGTATVARPSHGSGGLEPLQQDGSVGPCPFQVQHVYSLGGHQAPCSWARIRFGNYLFTNSFDGLVNAYTLPEASATYEDACPRAQGPVPVIQPSATYDDSAFAMAAAPPGEGAGSIAVCAVDLSADASRMATGGNDLVVKLWDVESNKVVSRLPGCRGWVWDIEAADDALNSALTASTDGIVRRWDLRAGHIASEYDMNFLHPGQAFPASGVCLRDDGVYYAAANFDSTVHIVDQRMNRAVTVLQDHTDRVSRVMIFEDTLMSCDFAGAIRLWQF